METSIIAAWMRDVHWVEQWQSSHHSLLLELLQVIFSGTVEEGNPELAQTASICFSPALLRHLLVKVDGSVSYGSSHVAGHLVTGLLEEVLAGYIG